MTSLLKELIFVDLSELIKMNVNENRTNYPHRHEQQLVVNKVCEPRTSNWETGSAFDEMALLQSYPILLSAI